MPVSLSAQLGSKEQADVRLAGSVMSALRVSMPGIVQSFDPDTVTVVVQPAIKGYEPDSNGINQSTTLPLLVDVPVVFPRGGGCTLTFPVKAGDECLVIFAD
ncbi:Gp138 family membrane-puncturing spike protein, partial [Escherichia coli]